MIDVKKILPVVQDVAFAILVLVGTVLGSAEITGNATGVSVEVRDAAELILNGVVALSVVFVALKNWIKRSNIDLAVPNELIEKLKELGLVD